MRSQISEAEALLFGLAGFLEAPDLSVYEKETRAYLRALWDRWWPSRDQMERLVLPKDIWRLSGARPLNHPQRRLGALAALVREWPRWLHSLGALESLQPLRDFLRGLRDPYWNRHYTLTSEPTEKEMALIGDSRIAEILANAVFPFFLAQGSDAWSHYEKLPAKLTNRRLETAVTRLFGPDPRRTAFVKTVAHQQGLLQIYEDFCLQDNSDCAHCPFPEQMQKWV